MNEIAMPRKALVSAKDAVAVIEKFFDHFQEGQYPEWSSDIWKQMSNALDQRWSGENVYNNVTKNRRDIMETACSNKNVPFIPFKSRCDKNVFDESMLDTSPKLDDNDIPYSYEEETVGLDYFEVQITPAEWVEMREPDTTYSDNRTYPILHRNVWTDTLAIAIDRQLELPCAFIFDKSKIYESPESLHYMRITGFCKSERCGNPLYCYLYEEPAGDRNFNIIVRTRDTLHDKHDKVERPLRGIRRQRIGEEVFNEGATNWHKRQVVENTRFGGRIPSHIPKPNILDQAKKQYVDRKLGIKPLDGKDLIRTIEEMKHSAPYLGFIHEVKRDKFYVSFSTPAQLHAYKQYCRTTKNLSSVCIDGTGSIVLPLIRKDGSPSGHTFLYSITINFNGTTVSVFDWLTESQDTDIIFWACKQWQKLGAPKPKEVVCDSSRALLDGLSLALNYQTVKVYIESCFLYASGISEYRYRSPIYTYLRLDVAHLMIMVRRWKCFDHMRHTVVRQFYQYCIGLMIDCQTLGQFKEIFQLTCTVGVNEFQDSVMESSGQTVLNSRRQLEEHIANRNFDLNFESITPDEITSKKNEEEDSTDNSRTKEFIGKLRKNAEVITHLGSESNLFFFPDFIDRFMLLAHEFPLWTAVAIPHVAEHASSAFVEGHFNIIKNRMLKNYSGRLRVDKFLKLIFNDYSGSAAIATSKLKVFNQNERPYPSPSMKPNIFLPRQERKTTQTSVSTLLPTKIQNLESCVEESTANGSTHLKSSPDWQDTGVADVNDSAIEIDNRFMEINKIEDFQDRFEELNTHVGSADTPVEIKAIVPIQPIPETRTAKGKYFKPNPGIQRRNILATNVQQSVVLRNGNLVMNPARIDGACYFATNTCGFDSRIQILSASAMDDPEYMSFVKKSTNETLQFLLNFIEKGPSADIYKQRVVLLKRLFESKIKANYDRCSKLKSYSIDIFGSLHTIWTTCFESEPSVHYIYQCPRCDIYSFPVSTLSVNHKMIGDQGFGALQEALVFHSHLSCINVNCTELCQVELAFNAQIFIELDIRPNLESLTGITCRLRDFPPQLRLNGIQYRLAGVVARLPGHYIAYCRRVNNRWELCNDTKSAIIHSGPNTTIEPHGVIYIISIEHKGVVADSSQSSDTSEPNLSRSMAIVSVGDNDTNGNNEEIPVSPDTFNRLEFPTTVALDDSDTTTRDNWRNKEAIEDICFGPSFNETAEDNISSQEPTLESTCSDYEHVPLVMLQSGNIMPGIIIDEHIFHLRDTNNFDSIVHILRCSALDETLYMDLMKKSPNETLQFTLNLIENNSHQDVYLRRAALLKSLYSEKILHEVENDIVLYTIDLSETPARTWETCLENEPSALREYECKSCKTYVLPTPILTVDPNVIARKGFVALEEALYFYRTLKKVKCRQEHCPELCTVTAYPNFHFYIECNVTSSDRSGTRLKCRLQDFPITLYLKGLPEQYRLRGIIAQSSDHIAAYCLRANNCWELYDSTATMTPNIHPSEAIEPHGVIYISIS